MLGSGRSSPPIRSRSAFITKSGARFWILDRQDRQGWGAKVIDRISADLRAAFPDMKGFSSRNLKYMSYFAKICPDLQIGQQSAAQLPWFHIVTLITKLPDPGIREWYAREAIQQA